METDSDENILDYWKLSNGKYIFILKVVDGLDGDIDKKIHYLLI